MHCGDKLPEAFEILKDKIEKDKIEGVITENSDFIDYHIVDQAGLDKSLDSQSPQNEGLQDKPKDLK